jgi:hypothetical protein
MQHISFDPVSSTAVDTWWDDSEPDQEITQRLRCYSPADLRLLLEGTGLELHGLLADGETIDPADEHPGHASMLRKHHEYLTVLRPATVARHAR